MNNLIIDLHGLTESEAIPRIQTALIDFLMTEDYDLLEIITGNGIVLKDVTLELLSEEDEINYYFDGTNYGSIIVERIN